MGLPVRIWIAQPKGDEYLVPAVGKNGWAAVDFSKPDRRWRFLYSSSPKKPPFRHYSVPRLLSLRDYPESVWLENKPLPSTKFHKKNAGYRWKEKKHRKKPKNFSAAECWLVIFLLRGLGHAPNCWFFDWSVARLIDWLIHLLISFWSIDWLTDRLINRSIFNLQM